MDASMVAVRIEPERSAIELPEAERALAAELAAALPQSAVELQVRVLADRLPARALSALAQEDPATGLIAVGSTHRAGLGRVVPGSVAEQLLGRARCPVAVAPRGYAEAVHDRLRVIGVGYDASSEAEAALMLAAGIATAADATLRVLAVEQPPANTWAAAAARTAVAQGGGDLQSRLHDAVAALPPKLRALPIFEHGAPAPRLVEHAEEGEDLLVLGSGGHGPLGATLLGGASRAVVESSPCPVIFVPRPALGHDSAGEGSATTRTDERCGRGVAG
jgi:nucleotide-binding universal stress UspA family protein